MRYLLGRILWLGPTLIATTVFGLLFLPAEAQTELEPGLPLFFNPAPKDARALSREAMEELIRAGQAAHRATETLTRLGGAALPHVLAEFDRLAPRARARVALGLAGIGRRIELASEQQLANPESAVLLWSRFWEDRALDFRPAVARSLARRMARWPSAARQEEILMLDTYALPALMEELGEVRERADVVRVARLSRILSQITAEPWVLSEQAEPAEARAVVAKWKRWWGRHRYRYLSLGGIQRLGAMVLDTRYGQWLGGLLEGRLDCNEGPECLLVRLVRAGPVTLWLSTVALLAGMLGGLALGCVSIAYSGSRLEFGLLLGASLLAGLPVATVAASTAPAMVLPSRAWCGALVVALMVSAWVFLYLRPAVRSIRTSNHHRALVAGGASPGRLALDSARELGVLAASLLAVHLPEVLSAVLILEHVWGLPGLGALTIQAVHDRDLGALSVVAALNVCVVSFFQLAADLLVPRLDPRLGGPVGSARTPEVPW